MSARRLTGNAEEARDLPEQGRINMRSTDLRLRAWKQSFVCMGIAIAGCQCEGEPNGLTRELPEIRVEPMILEFGDVPTGAMAMLPLAISNVGSDALHICVKVEGDCFEISKLAPEDAPFEPRFDTASPSWNVEKGDRRDLEIVFSPQVEGAIEAKLTLAHDGRNGPTTEVILRGNGVPPRVSLSTDVLDFGEVTVGERKELDLVLTNDTPFVQAFTITPSDGVEPTTVFGAADLPGSFESGSVGSFQGMIPNMGSLTVKIYFRPQERGPVASSLAVRYCATCAKDVAVRGVGIQPAFALEPATIDFGSIAEGGNATKPFSIKNVGDVTLTVHNVAIDGGNTDYTATPQTALPTQIAPGAAVIVDVLYSAVTPGRDQDRVRVETNAWDDPATPGRDAVGYVELTGSSDGPDIHPLPAQINFGSVGVGAAAQQRTLLLQNAGTAPLTISAIDLATNTPEITLSGAPAFPAVVDPGASVELKVHYGPTDAGADTAEVRVTSDDRDEGTLIVPVAGVGGVPTVCAIAIAPAQVTFGLVERGRISTMPVEIRNGGAQPCTVSNLHLAGAPEFTLPTAPGPTIRVAPGGAHRLDIAYAPAAYGTHTGTLELDSDDPTQAHVSVNLSGTSAPSDLLVVPSELKFNVVPVQCTSPRKTITLYNTGTSPITITRVELDPLTSPEFQLDPYTVPTTIAPGSQSELYVKYGPIDIGPDSGVLFITHSASPMPVAVPLTGESQVSPRVTDNFQQVPTPSADVLFIVDNSCSMAEEQASLGGNLNAFLQAAQAQNIDYHIAVTTTDVETGSSGIFGLPAGEQGRFVGNTKIITPATPNASQVFQDNVNRGTEGSGEEKGLEAAYLALSDPLINTDNAGFLRPDAALALIFVTDEEDASPRDLSFYEDFFRNVKGIQNSAMFSASGVIGIDNSCWTAVEGARYKQIVSATGGVMESICAPNWGQTLANIGLNAFGLKRQFTLSSQPVPTTVSVQVNGSGMPSTSPGGQQNWVYDAQSNTVTFQGGSVPPSNANIVVDYSVACAN